MTTHGMKSSPVQSTVLLRNNMPQIKSTLLCVLAILIGAPLVGAYFAWQVGELTSWTQFPQIIEHGTLSSVMMAIGWIFLRSPWASKFTELLNIKTDPSGKQEMTKITIEAPVPVKEEVK